MDRPYRHHTNDELGAEFAACCKLGGRPLSAWRGQVSYADLSMVVLLEEYSARRYEADRLAMDRPLVADDESQDQLPF